MPVKVIDGEKTFGYEREVTYEEYQQTGGIINCYFRVNTENYNGTKITVSNRYFNDSDEVTLREGTKISIVDNDTNKDGELVWYVGETSSSQTATVTISNTDVAWTLNELTNFNVTQSNNQLTITPKSMNNEVEETLTVTTADGMEDELVLKVVEKPVETIVWLTMKYKFYGYTETITDTEPTITISDTNITASFGSYDRTKGWPLTINNADQSTTATITFTRRMYYVTYTKTVNIADLLKETITEVTLE